MWCRKWAGLWLIVLRDFQADGSAVACHACLLHGLQCMLDCSSTRLSPKFFIYFVLTCSLLSHPVSYESDTATAGTRATARRHPTHWRHALLQASYTLAIIYVNVGFSSIRHVRFFFSHVPRYSHFPMSLWSAVIPFELANESQSSISIHFSLLSVACNLN